ncbi:MAG: hypothetical protein AB7R77_05910 [Ilumatobacteraceae bacterium]|jgi:hypothetical protein
MDVELTPEESEAVRQALRSYLSDLRMEITDTDNPEYRRTLRDERATLESAMTKLGGTTPEAETTSTEASAQTVTPTLRVVRMWWTSSGS